MRTDNRRGSLVSFYAAGVGVMFLLFSWSTARRRAARRGREGHARTAAVHQLGMTGVLAGKWLFLALVGCGAAHGHVPLGLLVFGLPLFSHLPGFAVMTLVTASAAAALGLVLATLAALARSSPASPRS